jgi:hypothetical protein
LIIAYPLVSGDGCNKRNHPKWIGVWETSLYLAMTAVERAFVDRIGLAEKQDMLAFESEASETVHIRLLGLKKKLPILC